ncbi:MAG: amino acid permease [Corynebacterium sp.]|nr:amino acid permease [Corynebacterium sp.]
MSAENLTGTESGSNLGVGLKPRHLTMMGLGSAIGAGLFLGTGVGIKAAGPAVLLAYVIAGFLVVCVMQMLGEMAAAEPDSGSFSQYAERAFGHWAGFTLGWMYWFMLIMVMGVEMTGAAAFIHGWLGWDPWIPALICVIFFTIVNLAAVRGFGEFEFWFAFVKVAVITIFLVIGLLLVFGVLPGHEAVGFSHIRESGFAPNGIGGIAAGLLAVAFAFGGIEIVTIAAAESENPRQAIKVAVRSVLWRISLFYLGSVILICLLLPYATMGRASSAAESPFTIILGMANIPGIVGIMEAVIVIALLSAFNAQLYATSRFAHSLAMRGDAPRWVRKTNSQGVPINSVFVSLFFAFVSVALQYWNPAGLLTFLMNAVGGCLLVIWAMICASQLKMRKHYEAAGELTVRMWGYPWLPWVTLIGIIGLGVLMLTDPGSRDQVIAVAVITVVLLVLSFITKAFKDKQKLSKRGA